MNTFPAAPNNKVHMSSSAELWEAIEEADEAADRHILYGHAVLDRQLRRPARGLSQRVPNGLLAKG